MINFDPITEYLKYKYKDNSIFILEDIMGDNWNESIIHFGNNKEESCYEIVTYDRIDEFEKMYSRKLKLNRIKSGI